MASILSFAVVIIAGMGEPVSLIGAAIFAGIASGRKTEEGRWATIGLGTAVAVGTLALMSWWLSIQDGADFRFPFVTRTISSFLQIWVISVATRKFRRKQGPDEIAPPTEATS